MRIWIGRGKTLFRWRLFGLETEFKMIPFGGLTFLTHGLRTGLRLRYFVAILAGPAANVLILLVALRFTSWQKTNIETSIAIGPIVFFGQMFVLIENLIPYRIQTALGTLCTDGLSLLQLIVSQSPEVFRSRQHGYDERASTSTGTRPF